jgi:hypothetical protein
LALQHHKRFPAPNKYQAQEAPRWPNAAEETQVDLATSRLIAGVFKVHGRIDGKK